LAARNPGVQFRELPMHTLDTYDLALNTLVVVMMPLIIVANLRMRGRGSLAHEWLWRETPNFMRMARVILGLLTLFSAVALLGNSGFVPEALQETLEIAIGVPFMAAAVAMIVLTVPAAVKIVRMLRARTTGT
jgi:hypothetical protein